MQVTALGRGTNGSTTRPYVSPTSRIAPIISRRSPALFTSEFQAAWATAESNTRAYSEIGDSPILLIDRSGAVQSPSPAVRSLDRRRPPLVLRQIIGDF